MQYKCFFFVKNFYLDWRKTTPSINIPFSWKVATKRFQAESLKNWQTFLMFFRGSFLLEQILLLKRCEN